ncbi:hypothetical protein BC830DRAFT_256731 [Chytriomyces sp. MP71]|nr:hypothetical protein BC830DRAFT_256731 [Chytriomyces sp. MP71]
MLRSAPLRRTCPDIIKARIEAASKLHLFVVQEMGPMAFIVKDATAAVIVNSGTQNEPNNTQSIHDDTKANMRQPPDRSNVKSYKVTLGNFQSCNCHTHLIENDLCVHILWVMIKVFRVSLESDVLYQNSLVEREIAELMDSRRRRKILPESSDSTVSDIKQNEAPLLKGHVRQRPIEDGDICPICMEDLDINIGAITYCKLSCGNNIHIKCMKILMDHQTKNMGLENIKCPLCRKDFGKYDDLKKELSEGYSTQIKMDNQSRHYGLKHPVGW